MFMVDQPVRNSLVGHKLSKSQKNASILVDVKFVPNAISG